MGSPRRSSGGDAGSSIRAQRGERDGRSGHLESEIRCDGGFRPAFPKKLVVAKGVLRFPAGSIDSRQQIGWNGYNPHPLAAAAGRRFDQEGKPKSCAAS